MATSLLHFTLLLLATLTLTFPATGKPTNHGTEKLTHLEFYFHDIQSGSNPTTINIVPINPSIPTAFGNLFMMDDPLTEKPEIESKMLGRAQGLYGIASQDLGSMVAMNFLFTTGRFNGSTLTVLGMNRVYEKMREMPVVGGSGIFRFARGYVQLTTYSFNLTTGKATVRCNVYVFY